MFCKHNNLNHHFERGTVMVKSIVKRVIGAVLLAVVMTLPLAAVAADKVRVAIGQKGLWDTMVTIHGIEEGFFAKEGLDVKVTWTRGGAETLQAVITGSVDFAFANERHPWSYRCL